jgi:hypothetical protein
VYVGAATKQILQLSSSGSFRMTAVERVPEHNTGLKTGHYTATTVLQWNPEVGA